MVSEEPKRPYNKIDINKKPFELERKEMIKAERKLTTNMMTSINWSYDTNYEYPTNSIRKVPFSKRAPIDDRKG